MLWAAAQVAAQGFAAHDTVTEYPHQGTYYHDRFVGRKTASGEIFDQNKFTAAHWKIKLGTLVLVTNRNSGLQVIVKVNDRCPRRGVLDLSHRAAQAIGIRGSQPVTVRILPDGYEGRWAGQEKTFDSVSFAAVRKAGAGTAKKAQAKHKPKPKPQPKPETAHNKKAMAAKQTRASQTGEKIENVRLGETRGCNIELGIAASHAEAYAMIQKLPEAYKGKVEVAPVQGGGGLMLTVETNLTRNKAKTLAKALKRPFPECHVVCRE